jgi:hypothetical protein
VPVRLVCVSPLYVSIVVKIFYLFYNVALLSDYMFRPLLN